MQVHRSFQIVLHNVIKNSSSELLTSIFILIVFLKAEKGHPIIRYVYCNNCWKVCCVFPLLFLLFAKICDQLRGETQTNHALVASIFLCISCTVEPRFMDNCLIWTLVIMDSFLGSTPHIFLKINNTDTISGPNDVCNNRI